jgi:type I restriction enzyme, S subunit
MNSNIPPHWKSAKLGDICLTTSGGTPSRGNKKYYEGNIPWVKSGELDKGLILDTEEKISEEAIKNSSAKIFPKGTLLIALYGATIGKLAFLGIDAATNQAICGIFKNENIDSNYLFHFLFYKKPSLINQGIGGAQPNISQGILKNLEIPLPPLNTQHLIVSIIEELFSELDKSVKEFQTAKQQLKTYRQSVLKWAFEGKLTNSEVRSQKLELAMAAETHEKYGKQNNLPEEDALGLPKGWKWVKIGDVVTGVEYGTSAKSREKGRVPVLRMGNIQNGKFDWTDLVYSDDDLEIKKYLLRKDDVLFNRTNSPELVGKTAIYKNEQPAIFAGYLIRINRIEKLIDADYLNYYLNSGIAKQYGNTVKTDGVNQSNINGQKLKNYPIPLTSLSEQKQIVCEIELRFSQTDKMEESINEGLQQAEALRQSILKMAFEGKLI